MGSSERASLRDTPPDPAAFQGTDLNSRVTETILERLYSPLTQGQNSPQDKKRADDLRNLKPRKVKGRNGKVWR